MKQIASSVWRIVIVAVGLGIVTGAGADNNGKPKRYRATLTGFSEVLPNVGGAVSTTGRGTLRVDIDEASQIMTYTLRFSGLEGTPTMSHLHFGQHHTTGGISVWLCQTATNPSPSPTPTCQPDVSITGTIVPINVVGPNGQGIAPGQFSELVAAIRAGVVYVNVHSTLYPPGEIRGQLF
jgi:hypothetical protein